MIPDPLPVPVPELAPVLVFTQESPSESVAQYAARVLVEDRVTGEPLVSVLPEAEDESLPIWSEWRRDRDTISDVVEDKDAPWSPPMSPTRALAEVVSMETPTEDGFFGLLTNPPGEWGVVSYGKDRALILRGNLTFLRRALQFLFSFAGGRMDGPESVISEVVVREQSATGGRMIPITEHRLKRALTFWFYAQLYPLRAPQDRFLIDSEGDFVGLRDLTRAEESAIMGEAEALSTLFYTHINHDGLGCGFVTSNVSPPQEHGLGAVVHPGAQELRD